MKYLGFVLLACAFFSPEIFGQDFHLPHIGPMGGRFNRLHTYLVEKNLKEDKNNSSEKEELEKLLNFGKKASKWLEIVNASRSADNQLDLSNPNPSGGGYTMTNPSKTNTAILKDNFEKYVTKTSPLITDFILNNKELPSTPPVRDEEFIVALRGLDKIYQNTIRWSGSLEWLDYYAEESKNDVRGFFFLKEIPDLKSTLSNFKNLSSEAQAQFRGWLFGLCRNSETSIEECHQVLNEALTNESLYDFYIHYLSFGEKIYHSFYAILKTRPEMYWAQNKFISPFTLPEKKEVEHWLKFNVEDEWKNESYKLIIDYKNDGSPIPRIEFKEGVTAHVNEIAGDLITMEAEYPIESADQRWTIRHEYGHVLGFSDCYLEFFDTEEKAMIYYELDRSNLMCSRGGSIKPQHFEELRKAYQ